MEARKRHPMVVVLWSCVYSNAQITYFTMPEATKDPASAEN